MKPFIRFTVSCLLLSFVFQGVDAQDSLQINSSSKSNFSIILATDYGKLVTTAAKLDSRYEFNLGIQFTKHIRFTADYGYAQLSPSNAIENGIYISTGNYYRAGLDYLINISPKTHLSLGSMYASSAFIDEGAVEIKSEIWPSLNERFERDGFSANWVEFVLTSESSIFNKETGFISNLYWGIKVRLRIMIEKPTPEQLDIYAIPGFGRTFNNLVPALNLFAAYKINR